MFKFHNRNKKNLKVQNSERFGRRRISEASLVPAIKPTSSRPMAQVQSHFESTHNTTGNETMKQVYEDTQQDAINPNGRWRHD